MVPSDEITALGRTDHQFSISPQEQARQAIPPIRGYVYQFHRTAEAWINLADDELLYLEVAEDFAKIVHNPDGLDDVLTATQVKDTRESGSVTLNSSDVLEAIQHLFDLQEINSGRKVSLTFLTTSPIGMERIKRLPSGKPGLDEWRLAAEGADVTMIRDALISRFPEGPLRTFIETSTADSLRTRLLKALTFSCGEPDWADIARKNRHTLIQRREEVNSSVDMAEKAYDMILIEVIQTILSSDTRKLDRPDFLACFQRATNIGVPSQLVEDAFKAISVEYRAVSKRLDDDALKDLARSLVTIGAPPTIRHLFPDAAPAALSAWDFTATLERSVVAPGDAERHGAARRQIIADLVKSQERQHLIVAAPGTGKTFSLWRLAEDLLKGSGPVPIFLPVATLESWQQVRSIILDVCPACNPDDVLRDSRVCVLLDGWSEFATGIHLAERAKGLRILSETRVVATARHLDSSDSAFANWTLETLPVDAVRAAISLARAQEPLPTAEVLDLLRLPLLLSLYLLSESGATRPGELLRQLHDHLAKALPESFSDALCVAAARVALTADQSLQNFLAELRDQAPRFGLSDPRQKLERLGTIVNRNGQILPIHDLYWSWLVGCGLLIDEQVAAAAGHIDVSEHLALAIQSGQRVDSATVLNVSKNNLLLAAEIEVGRRSLSPHAELFASIKKGLTDTRLSVRIHSSIAALKSRDPRLLKQAFDTYNETLQLQHHLPEWREAVTNEYLFDNRHTLIEWCGAGAADFVLDIIAERGGAQWLPWLGQLVEEHPHCNRCLALAAALACAPSIPAWGHLHLREMMVEAPWLLRYASRKGANVELARWVASNYVDVVESRKRGSGWTHVNDVLVNCGDDTTFQIILNGFEGMPRHSLEVVCFAVVKRGAPWVGNFQMAAFASRKKTREDQPFHELSDAFAPEISDVTARQWIADGYDQEGWRVLAARHGNDILPELIGELPETFSDQHYISALANMRHFQNTPASIIPEMFKRIRGNMMPMAMEHALEVLATAQQPGMLAIVDFMVRQGTSMPGYHINASVQLYEAWRKRSSKEILVKTRNGAMPYSTWATALGAIHWDGDFTPRMISQKPEMATEIVLNQFAADDLKAEAVLRNVKQIQTYNPKLFQRMISVPPLAKLILDVFQSCLDTFPAHALLALLRSQDISQGLLLVYLGKTSNPAHKPAHAEIIKRALTEETNLHYCRYIGNMLRGYPRHEVVQLLKDTTSPEDDRSIWLIRQVELARKQILLDESHNWISA